MISEIIFPRYEPNMEALTKSNLIEAELRRPFRTEVFVKIKDRKTLLRKYVGLWHNLLDEMFNKLSEPAANWLNESVQTMNKHKEIQDFEEIEPCMPLNVS